MRDNLNGKDRLFGYRSNNTLQYTLELYSENLQAKRQDLKDTR